MGKSKKEIDLGNWVTQLRKGLLELCIVNLLAGGDLYGYDLVKRLALVKGLVITEGTVYPLLSRLKAAGLLETYLAESPAGPARKYYTLTRDGKTARKLMQKYWRELAIGVDSLIESETENG